MKNKKNTNPYKSWAECIWSLTNFLPSLQLMFIFGLLLSAEAQAFGRDRPNIKGRPLPSFFPNHPHNKAIQQTRYEELLHLCENFTPEKFSQARQLLITESRAASLLIDDANNKRNPLTIAQKTENTDLAKLVLDTTGTLYCSQEQQPSYTTIPTQISEKKFSITLLMLQAGCKLLPAVRQNMHCKHINGLTLVDIVLTMTDTVVLPDSLIKLNEATFIAFLDQLDVTIDNQEISKAVTFALFPYLRALDILIMYFPNLIVKYEPQRPSLILFEWLTFAFKYGRLKAANYLLRFIATEEQLNTYIQLSSESASNSQLLVALHKIKGLIDSKIDEKNLDNLDSEAAKTLVYLNVRLYHFSRAGNIQQLKKALLASDKIFGQHKQYQVYIIDYKIATGQFNDVIAILLNLTESNNRAIKVIKEKGITDGTDKTLRQQNQDIELYIDLINRISMPHPITIEGIQPPSLAMLPLANIRPNDRKKFNALVYIEFIATKIQMRLLNSLKSIHRAKTNQDKKQQLDALMKEIKRIENHLLYFLESTLTEIFIESMQLADTVEESFRYFKMAMWLDPITAEKILFNRGYRNKVMIFVPHYPAEMYNYIKRKLSECERYTPTQLHDVLVLAKEVIKVYYDRLLPSSVFSTRRNLDHLNTLLITLTAPGGYSKLGEEVILDEINALQQHNLLDQEFIFGNKIFTLKTLKSEFSKLRPYTLNLLASFVSLVAGIPLILYGLYLIIKSRRVNPPSLPPANLAAIAKKTSRKIKSKPATVANTTSSKNPLHTLLINNNGDDHGDDLKTSSVLSNVQPHRPHTDVNHNQELKPDPDSNGEEKATTTSSMSY